MPFWCTWQNCWPVHADWCKWTYHFSRNFCDREESKKWSQALAGCWYTRLSHPLWPTGWNILDGSYFTQKIYGVVHITRDICGIACWSAESMQPEMYSVKDPFPKNNRSPGEAILYDLAGEITSSSLNLAVCKPWCSILSATKRSSLCSLGMVFKS